VAACNGRACKTDALVGSSEQACLSAVSWSLVWAAQISTAGEIIGEKDCNNRDFVYKCRYDVFAAISKPVAGFDTGRAATRIPAYQRNLRSASLQKQSVYPSTRCHNPQDHTSDRVLRFAITRSVQ
jgi:hypothetical protein